MVVYVYNSHDWASNGTLIMIVMVPLMDINASLYGSSLAKNDDFHGMSLVFSSWWCILRFKPKKTQDSRVIYSENGWKSWLDDGKWWLIVVGHGNITKNNGWIMDNCNYPTWLFCYIANWTIPMLSIFLMINMMIYLLFQWWFSSLLGEITRGYQHFGVGMYQLGKTWGLLQIRNTPSISRRPVS